MNQCEAHLILTHAWTRMKNNANTLAMLGQELIRTRQEYEEGKELISKFINDFLDWHKLNMAFYTEVQRMAELCALYRAMMGNV